MNRQRLDAFSDPVAQIYLNIENEITLDISKSLANNKELLSTDPTAWKLQQMQNLGMMDKRTLETIKQQSGLTSRELNGALYGAGLEGLSESEEEIQKATKAGARLVVPPAINKSPQMFKILSAYERQAKDKLNLTNQILIKASKQKHIDIVNKVTAQTLAGVKSGEQAMREAVRSLADDGITIVKNKAGHKLSTEGYVRSIVRSATNNTVNEMQDERFKEWGVGYVEISSHAGNRPGCRPYAGRIFALSEEGATKEYPYLYDPSIGRIGAADSLFGINCGHTKYPFFPGVSQRTFSPPTNEEKDQKVYQESQKQRSLERGIRKAKHQKKMFEANGDMAGAAQAQKLISARQKKMRTFINSSGRTRRSAREQIGGGGGLSSIPKPMVNIPIPPSLKADIVSPAVTKAVRSAPKPGKAMPNPPVVSPEVSDLNKAKTGDIVKVDIDGKIEDAMLIEKGDGFIKVDRRDGSIKIIQIKPDTPVKTKPAPKKKTPIKKDDGDSFNDIEAGSIARVKIDGKVEDAMVIEKGKDFIKVDTRSGDIRIINFGTAKPATPKTAPVRTTPTRSTAPTRPQTAKPMAKPDSVEVVKDFEKMYDKKVFNSLINAKDQESFNKNLDTMVKGMFKKTGGMDDVVITLDPLKGQGVRGSVTHRMVKVNGEFVEKVTHFRMRNDLPHSNAYKTRVMFHEMYHARGNGSNMSWKFGRSGAEGKKFAKDMVRYEEVFTELAAHRMARHAGVTEELPFSYAKFMAETLPRLKYAPEFKDAKTISEMGDIAMGFRFGKGKPVSDFSGIIKNAESVPFDFDKYAATHYKKYIIDNSDSIALVLKKEFPHYNHVTVESLSANIKKQWTERVGHGYKNGLEHETGYQALITAMNRIGVK